MSNDLLLLSKIGFVPPSLILLSEGSSAINVIVILNFYLEGIFCLYTSSRKFPDYFSSIIFPRQPVYL